MKNVPKPQKKSLDWHRADVVAALHKCGWSINSLAKAHGISPSTLRSALDKSYPKSERLIAQAIGIAPETIWPERFAARNFIPTIRNIKREHA